MLQTAFAAALFLTAAATGPGAGPNICINESAFLQNLEGQMPGLKVAALSGPEAQVFVAKFNALPPPTDAHADLVLVLTLPDAPQAVIVFFAGDCLIGKATMPRPLLEMLLRQLAEEA